MRKVWLVDVGVFRYLLVGFASRPAVKEVASFLFILLSLLKWLVLKKVSATNFLMKAHRFYPNAFYTRIIKRALPGVVRRSAALMANGVTLSMAISRSIIIKMPMLVDGKVSKGIIIISYTDTNQYYFHNVDVKSLLRYFHVVLEPSSAGYCLPEILFWSEYDESVFVQATEVTDRKFLEGVSRNYVPLEFGASDWVNYKIFFPVKSDQVYDSVYIANYNPVKRLHVYFKALRVIKNKGVKYKGAIVCALWGGYRESALKLIEYYDIQDMLDVHERFNAEQLNDILNKSGCNLLLSLKEGSNRSLFEAMFCDTPAIALKNNVGINKDYINSFTGMLIDDGKLAESLLLMRSARHSLSPEKWAMENISPEVTTKKLVNAIKFDDESFQFGGIDILVKTNDPEVSYLDKDAGIDKDYFVEKVLKLFDKDNREPGSEKEILALTDEFYTGNNAGSVSH